jgi:hypothetical protein
VRTTGRKTGIAGIVALLVSLAACGGEDEDPSSAAPASEVGSTDLRAAGCPSTVVVQTDWNPEAEHGGVYQLLGDDREVDAGSKSVTGTLVDAAGDSTGVLLEVRAGGPAIGFQTVTSQMYADDSITLGFVSTDEAIRLSADQPTTAVMAALEIGPNMTMWDPETHPDVETIADLGEQGIPVRYYEGSTYIEYFVGAGVLNRDQLDGSYDGTPAAFVASGGETAQQGFASSEPYLYEHDIEEWGKPVAYQLDYDAGYQPYQSSISVRADDLPDLAGCLADLVPLMQQGVVDFVADHAAVGELILELVEEYDTGWVQSQGLIDYAVTTMQDLGIMGNGSDDVQGNFDLDRVQTLMDQVEPVFTAQGTPPADGLAPQDLVTDEFIDDSIGFPAS